MARGARLGAHVPLDGMGDVVRFPVQQQDAPPAPERLWRELVGEELHRERTARGERLKDVAERAGVSVQYLSEVERGVKEASWARLFDYAGIQLLLFPAFLLVARTISVYGLKEVEDPMAGIFGDLGPMSGAPAPGLDPGSFFGPPVQGSFRSP